MGGAFALLAAACGVVNSPSEAPRPLIELGWVACLLGHSFEEHEGDGGRGGTATRVRHNPKTDDSVEVGRPSLYTPTPRS